jgi:hypothetical protein
MLIRTTASLRGTPQIQTVQRVVHRPSLFTLLLLTPYLSWVQPLGLGVPSTGKSRLGVTPRPALRIRSLFKGSANCLLLLLTPYLPWVHYVIRVEKGLHRFHHFDGHGVCYAVEELLLLQADAMLA